MKTNLSDSVDSTERALPNHRALPATVSPVVSSSESESTDAVVQQADPNGQTGVSTRCVHGGEQRQKSEGAIATPIYNASTFTFESTDELLDFVEGRKPREEYGRYGNPNERVVEAKLAALEGAEDAILYSSGMAAIVGLLMTRLSAGDEIVFFDQCYHRSREFCSKHLARFGVVTRQVPTGDFAAMEAAINSRTKMLVSESPTNPHLTCVDLEQFAALGKDREIETLIDATLATPMNLKPIDFGVDYVLHSATKYLGGHNDLLAGVICGRKELLDPVRSLRGCLGSINSPQSLYLLERGLKTFALRMARHNENGMAVASFLDNHPRIERVYYPGLKSHPTHEIASQQMNGFGGLITFTVKDADWQTTAKVVDGTRLARIAPSLGGVESLIEQPLVMSYFNYSPEERESFGIADNMIRFSCGIEDSADLIADLDQALRGI
ncbi:cystathionine gamma-synthase [Neorhodopirellula lusitana]|uniref:Cystathionine gamma-synthase n=1 Tax=Neorhodopirellula lusitana TaxID=445327 RepID=A0ABY1PNF1_9BACT|nr:aminotransferase class I/II-fold pyridoxal phosphate-dependent enzyme [Neorhodopirellula lusitana]SMP39179.1 cystathionine gamma-synthase [Neorhodopirellula lusitana]